MNPTPATFAGPPSGLGAEAMSSGIKNSDVAFIEGSTESTCVGGGGCSDLNELIAGLVDSLGARKRELDEIDTQLPLLKKEAGLLNFELFLADPEAKLRELEGGNENIRIPADLTAYYGDDLRVQFEAHRELKERRRHMTNHKQVLFSRIDEILELLWLALAERSRRGASSNTSNSAEANIGDDDHPMGCSGGVEASDDNVTDMGYFSHDATAADVLLVGSSETKLNKNAAGGHEEALRRQIWRFSGQGLCGRSKDIAAIPQEVMSNAIRSPRAAPRYTSYSFINRQSHSRP
jgi:hypothetical protein